MVHIQLQDAVAARLAELAKSQGLSLEAYLTKMSEAGANEVELQRPTITGEEFDRLLDGEVSADTTYQGAYPRADIYVDHD
jgi:hypothetical protein